MAKISQEEYEVLKGLDDQWRWIARNSYGGHGGDLFVYPEKPFKNHYSGGWVCGIWIHPINNHLFQFIQWENEEPYNIQELIDEYLDDEYGYFNMKLSREFEEFIETEREETEVKSKQELIEKWESAIEAAEFYGKGKEVELISYMKDFVSDLNQLDEPETLSEHWIEQKSIDTHVDTANGDIQVTFILDDLQNLLVPKQELPVIPKFVADWVESRDYYNVYKVLQDLSAPGSPHASKDVRNWIFRNQENVEKFVRAWLDDYEVEEEQLYYVLNSEGETMIRKNDSGVGTSSGFKIKNWLNNESYKLTEQEIKDYDPRFWPFAVKVEEVE